jgi:hypothetical protein
MSTTGNALITSLTFRKAYVVDVIAPVADNFRGDYDDLSDAIALAEILASDTRQTHIVRRCASNVVLHTITPVDADRIFS